MGELEDTVVEIAEGEQNFRKRMKRNEDSQRPLEHLMHQHLNYRGPRRRRSMKKSKSMRKYLRTI